MVPRGFLRLFAPGRGHAESEQQSERQRRLFEQFVPAGSVVFDVGANVGNRVAALLNCGATVVAVEPQPGCVAQLKGKFRDRITVVQCAVGDAPGKLTLRMSGPLDTMASLSPEFIAQARETKRFGSRNWTESIDVDVTTLDGLISRFGTPSFIKIDVEGFEYEALCGLSHAVEVISFEWSSDAPAKTVRCIDRLLQLGMPHFQFSFGESMQFAHRVSLDASTAKKLVELLGEEPTLFGDIYASRRALVRR
jgi:FkbM family methyltransferase